MSFLFPWFPDNCQPPFVMPSQEIHVISLLIMPSIIKDTRLTSLFIMLSLLRDICHSIFPDTILEPLWCHHYRQTSRFWHKLSAIIKNNILVMDLLSSFASQWPHCKQETLDYISHALSSSCVVLHLWWKVYPPPNLFFKGPIHMSCHVYECMTTMQAVVIFLCSLFITVIWLSFSLMTHSFSFIMSSLIILICCIHINDTWLSFSFVTSSLMTHNHHSDWMFPC